MPTPTAVSPGRLARCLSLRSLAGLGRLVALLLGEAAPDAVDLPGPAARTRDTGPDRAAQIALASAACPSDLPVDEIGKNRSGSADRQAASCPPLPSAISRATSARYGDSWTAASSRRLGRGYALRAPRPTRKERAWPRCGRRCTSTSANRCGRPGRAAQALSPARVAAQSRAMARLAETSTCTAVRGRSVRGAAVARITMIRRRLVTCLVASLVVARLPAGNFSSGLTGRARLGALPSRPAPAHHPRRNYPVPRI